MCVDALYDHFCPTGPFVLLARLFRLVILDGFHSVHISVHHVDFTLHVLINNDLDHFTWNWPLRVSGEAGGGTPSGRAPVCWRRDERRVGSGGAFARFPLGGTAGLGELMSTEAGSS